MRKHSIFVPAANNSWSIEEVRKLRDHAQSGRSVREIARELNRTESSVRNKAGMHGISLGVAAGVKETVEP